MARIDRGDLAGIGGLHKADGGVFGIGIGIQKATQFVLFGGDFGLGFANKFNDVKAARGDGTVFGAEQLAQHVPAFILLGQFHDLVIDAFNRHRVKFYKGLYMTQSTVKAVITDNRDRLVFGQRNNPEGDFLDHAKAALGPGNQEGQVHIPRKQIP